MIPWWVAAVTGATGAASGVTLAFAAYTWWRLSDIRNTRP
jgi:hypothetical protein